jgi:hypothetical protein
MGWRWGGSVYSRPGARGLFVVNTAAFYAGRWVSCRVDFLKNAPPLAPAGAPGLWREGQTTAPCTVYQARRV